MQPTVSFSMVYFSHIMEEEFRIFVIELFNKIESSFVLIFREVIVYLAQVPSEVTILLGICSIILFLRIPFLRTILFVPYLLVRPLLLFFGFISKKTELWSVVYDSKTKYPLDPVYVSITDMQGVEVASAVTDLEGRFGVVLPRGTYTIMVQKTHYSFPSKILQGKKNDGYRNQLYFGERVTIVDEERVLAFHIPMDPLEEDWNQLEKKRMGLFGIFRKKKITGEAAPFFGSIGALFALAQYIQYPSALSQRIAVGYGALLFVYTAFSLLKGVSLHHSVVLDSHTKKPIPFARIKLFTKEKQFQVAKRITTIRGQFVCLLSPGIYYATIEKRNADGSYELVHTSAPFTVKDGYISKKFVV